MQDLIVYFSTQEKCGCLPEVSNLEVMKDIQAFSW
jgi:hypothetical protein